MRRAALRSPSSCRPSSIRSRPHSAARGRARCRAAAEPAAPAIPTPASTTAAATSLGGEVVDEQPDVRPATLHAAARRTTASASTPITRSRSATAWRCACGARSRTTPCRSIDRAGQRLRSERRTGARAGVRNARSEPQVEQQRQAHLPRQRGVYASLEAAQPVRVFVTGFVRARALWRRPRATRCCATSTRAGGIDPDRGSYIDVRRATRRADCARSFDLYRFLLDGQIAARAAAGRRHHRRRRPRSTPCRSAGEVFNPYVFEFATREHVGRRAARARAAEAGRHAPEHRAQGRRQTAAANTTRSTRSVRDRSGRRRGHGDVRSYPGTILVRIEGAHLGELTLLTLPYGTQLQDAMALFDPTPQAQPEAVQLFRTSVAAAPEGDARHLAARPRDLRADGALRHQRGGGAAHPRGRADHCSSSSARARSSRAARSCSRAGDSADTLLEDGDVLLIPERSKLVLVNGEVSSRTRSCTTAARA